MNPHTPALGFIVYCRAGFENECAAEAEAFARRSGLQGFVRTSAGSGFVHYVLHEVFEDWQALAAAAPFERWIFARQRCVWVGRVADLPNQDRVTPLVREIDRLGLRVGRVWAETADTNEAKEISGFLKRFTPHLERKLSERGLLREQAAMPTLHLFFQDATKVDLGLSMPADASPWPMGIARLRMPRGAPSRSTLKLAEAFYALMSEEEQAAALRPGLRAVDLGAAPGGWSLQFAERGLLVTAVDNGPLADTVKATGMVDHVKADGFTFRPAKKVEWMVCDMIEQPVRIASLAADWVASGRCRRSIFNLKLPMKKRVDEVERCRAAIHQRMKQGGRDYELRMKHLYHDREEITAYLALA